MFELTIHESIRDVGEAVWSRLAGSSAAPFLCWDFLDALEQTGCVHPSKGWKPCPLILKRRGEPVAAVPAYLKGHSEGEFVFDHGWASFAEGRLGLRYYPKLIVASPFTPATAPRVLAAPDEPRAPLLGALVSALRELVDRLDVSGAHVLFPSEAEAEMLSDHGMAHRHGIQYHWRNAGYASFDDFLGRFDSKKRNQIRRERREIEKRDLDVRVYDGREAPAAVIDFAYECYASTVNKYFWGRQYLNREFFHEVSSRLGARAMIVVATDRSSKRPLASAYNLVGQDALYGRYWGAAAEVPYLHFNVCYYEGIRYCIERRLELFEPGAGGDHKLARGFEPAITHSVHVLSDPRLDAIVRDALSRERRAVLEHLEEYRRDPVLKPV